MKKKYTFPVIMLILVVFLSNIAIMGVQFNTVTMTELYANYPEWVVNAMMAWPGLVGMFACLACGRICDKVDKKWVFVIGMILFALTGTNLGGIAYSNNLLLIGCACFNGGLCYGMCSVSVVGIITDCFTDEEQRGTVMGWYNGAMALVGAVLSFAYGVVATIKWTLASQVNWISLLVVILAIIFIPACPPRENPPAEKSEKVKGEKGWAKRLIPLVVSFFLVSFAAMSIYMFIDLYVTGNNLGDAALTGTFVSVQTIASFIACTFFGVLYKKFGNRLSIPCYLLMALAFLFMYLAPSKASLLIGAAVFGASWGTAYTYWFVRATVVVPENMVGTATGIITTANSLSYMPMSYFMTGVMGAMGMANFRDMFPIYIAIIAVVFVGAIFLNAKKEEA